MAKTPMTDKVHNSLVRVEDHASKAIPKTYLLFLSLYLCYTRYALGISIAGRIPRVCIAIDFPRKRFNALYAWTTRFIRLALSPSLFLRS